MSEITHLPNAVPANLSSERVSLHLIQIVPGDPDHGFVPYYKFSIQAADSFEVGHISFRIGDNEHVRFCSGHIGYGVHEPNRGHGYAYQACQAIAPFVRSIYPSVIITADPDNHASIRTIERLGAVFIDEVPVPPYDPHYKKGSRSKRRYQWTP